MTSTQLPSLAQRVRESEWGGGSQALAAAAVHWEDTLFASRSTMDEHARRLATPGLMPPARMLRQGLAMGLSQIRYALRHLPGDFRNDLRPVNETEEWAKGMIARTTRDQCEFLGPSGAEIARILDASEGLAPGIMVEEIRRRPVKCRPVPAAAVNYVLRKVFDGAIGPVEPDPVAYTPVSQMHRATLDDGRNVLVRVQRPGIVTQLRGDARVTATLIGPLESQFSTVQEQRPGAFVELATRQIIEETDLRNEALNAVLLALAAEEIGVEGVVIPRPVPGFVDSRAVVFDDIGGRPFGPAAHTLAVDKVVNSLVGISAETGLVKGIFHADLRPENLLVLEDGSIGIASIGTLGCFDDNTRQAAFKYLTTVFSGDFRGQVDAMELAGAVTPETDKEALVEALANTESLQPAGMFGSGGEGVMNALGQAVGVLLEHNIEPNLATIMFVRDVFQLRYLIGQIDENASVVASLLPLMQRLPLLLQEQEQ